MLVLLLELFIYLCRIKNRLYSLTELSVLRPPPLETENIYFEGLVPGPSHKLCFFVVVQVL